MIRTLSETPFGRVYRATGGPNGQDVALKEIAFAVAPDARAIDKFEEEARLLAQLHHEGIPEFVAHFRLRRARDTRLYFAQRYIHGQDLERKFVKHRFDQAGAMRIAEQVLAVLHYLHSRSPKILHRDIKPGNIIESTGTWLSTLAPRATLDFPCTPPLRAPSGTWLRSRCVGVPNRAAISTRWG